MSSNFNCVNKYIYLGTPLFNVCPDQVKPDNGYIGFKCDVVTEIAKSVMIFSILDKKVI